MQTNRKPLLIADVEDLIPIYEAVRAQNEELNALVKDLSEKNEYLRDTLAKREQIEDFIRCQYQAFVLAKIFHTNHWAIGKIAESMHLFDDPRAALRIPRVNTLYPKKSETIMLFSKYGFVKMYRQLHSFFSRPQSNEDIYTILKDEMETIAEAFSLQHKTLDEILDRITEDFKYTLQKLAE